MTAAELSYRFFLAYDKAFEGAAPGYDDKQVSTWLSNAQYRVFDKYYRQFERSEAARRALEPMIKSTSILSTSAGVHPNGYFINLPTDFMYAIEEAVTLTGATSESCVKPITHDFYALNRSNPYKKPYSDVVWRMDVSSDTATKKTEIITDGTAISNYRLQYLTKITDIVVDSSTPANDVDPILDSTVHDEIITEAVKIAVAATKPDEYQIAALENNSN